VADTDALLADLAQGKPLFLSSTLAKNLPVHRAREMWNMGSFSTIS